MPNADPIKQLGTFKALTQSIVQFNSVVFRLIVGVFGYVPAEALAIVTSLEYVLNMLLEVPLGVVADRYGRARCAIIGMILISLSLFSMYIAIVLYPTAPTLGFIFISLDGVLLGFGKPFLSGSVEAFYQSAIKKHKAEGLNTSFSTATRHGRYYTTIAVCIAFALVYVFRDNPISIHLLLVGALLWWTAVFKFSRDYLRYGDLSAQSTALESSSVGALIKLFATNKHIRFANLTALLFFMLVGTSLSYLIVSIGRFYGDDPITGWYLMAAFILGNFTLGWITLSFLLTRMVKHLSPTGHVLSLIGIQFVANFGMFLIFQLDYIPLWLAIVCMFIYGVCLVLSIAGLQAFSTNYLFTQVNEKQHSSSLSLQSMLGYLFVGLYSVYLTFFKDGAPTPTELFLTVSAFSGLGFLLVSISRTPNESYENTPHS